ncbi:MAG: hypothetical protein ACI8RZ_004126 [Myxococcota bacterium]|jgi:hypothetical protein
MNVGNDPDTAFDMLDSFAATAPCLLETDDIYATYPRSSEAFAPFPVHVVIDRSGVVVYLANQYDAEALKSAITEALKSE